MRQKGDVRQVGQTTMTKRKKDVEMLRLTEAGEAGAEEGLEGCGMTMQRLRDLGLDQQFAGNGATVGGGVVVPRLSAELEEWVRNHLTKRAERAGGLKQENVM